jgi:hypothetical protein
MEKSNTLPFSRALPPTPTIKVYSDNKELTTQELFLLDYVKTNPAHPNESKEIRKLRAQVHSARLAVDHFNQEKLSPILPALEFEALRKGA